MKDCSNCKFEDALSTNFPCNVCEDPSEHGTKWEPKYKRCITCGQIVAGGYRK